MAWGGSQDGDVTDALYAPLPTLNGEELDRLRAVIGPPSAEHRAALARPRVEVEARVPQTEAGEVDSDIRFALQTLQSAIDDMRHELKDVSARLDDLTRSLLG